MTKTNLLLFTFLTIGSNSFAANQAPEGLGFAQILPMRENYQNRLIRIEGKVKSLKTIKEGGGKFATFFLADADNPETTISVKVPLTKKKTVINTFDCKNGDFTTVQGIFKPWGSASYLGKIEMRDHSEFTCSETATHKVKTPDVIVKKKAPEVPKPVILQISGDSSKVIDPQGKRISEVGSVLEPGTSIATGDHSSVQIKYPDGSRVSVGAKSKLVTEAGTVDAQSVNLNFGRINALIHKQKSVDLHFKVKTKSATMGVRGTHFVVDAEPSGKSSTHVLEGRVDVAKDEKRLLAGEGVHVLQDQFVDVDKNKISEVKAFKGSEFIDQMKQEQPELMAFADIAEKAPEAAAPTPTPVVQAPVKNEIREEAKKSSWAIFRLAGLGYFAKGVTTHYSGIASWNPEFDVGANWNLGVDLGFTNLQIGSARSSAIEYAAVGAYDFNPSFALEIKAGAQSFLSPASATGAIGGLALRYRLCEKCFVNHLIFGDDVMSLKSTFYNIARLGVGFQF
jgi:hypothetical protein